MAVVGVGIDIVEVGRIENALMRFGDKFLERVFTENERTYSLRRPCSSMHLSARFAAKEAVLKALGTGMGKISLGDIEIVNDDTGAPRVNLSGKAEKMLTESGGGRVLLSISHTKEVAIAQAILVRGE